MGMKCIDCKLIKYDGKEYHCPAHPYAQGIDIYTEHPDCHANVWYPQYLNDRIRSIEQNYRVLDEVLAKVYDLLDSLKQYPGYGDKIRNDLAVVYDKYAALCGTMTKEHADMQKELERIDDKEEELKYV